MWLEYNKMMGGEQPSKFVVLEDVEDMSQLPPEMVYMCNPDIGLTLLMADSIIRYLNRQ